MDWNKSLKAGLKSGIITLLGILLSVIVAVLTYAMGYRPEGQIQSIIFNYVIVPILAGLVGILNNWLKHKDGIIKPEVVKVVGSEKK